MFCRIFIVLLKISLCKEKFCYLFESVLEKTQNILCVFYICLLWFSQDFNNLFLYSKDMQTQHIKLLWFWRFLTVLCLGQCISLRFSLNQRGIGNHCSYLYVHVLEFLLLQNRILPWPLSGKWSVKVVDLHWNKLKC